MLMLYWSASLRGGLYRKENTAQHSIAQHAQICIVICRKQGTHMSQFPCHSGAVLGIGLGIGVPVFYIRQAALLSLYSCLHNE